MQRLTGFYLLPPNSSTEREKRPPLPSILFVYISGVCAPGVYIKMIITLIVVWLEAARQSLSSLSSVYIIYGAEKCSRKLIQSSPPRKCTHIHTNERVIDANCACSFGAAAIRLIAAITLRHLHCVCALVGPTRGSWSPRDLPVCALSARTESNNGPKKARPAGCDA